MVFNYSARNASGHLITGIVDGISEDAVAEVLRQRGLFATDISPHGKTIVGLGGMSTVKGEILAAFFRSFAMMIKQGVPLARTIEICVRSSEKSDKRLHEALSTILIDIQSGKSLASAFEAHPGVFPRLYIAMLRAGETGGILDESLERLAEIAERESATRKKIQGAMVYPLTVLSFSMIMVLIILWKVVPMFSGMFDSFGVPVTGATAIVFGVSKSLSHFYTWILLALGIAGSFYGGRMYFATEKGKLNFEIQAKRVPLLGQLIDKMAIAQVTRMLGMLLNSGVQLALALDVAAPVSSSQTLANGLMEIRREIEGGSRFSEAVERSKAFDPISEQLITSGDESGSLAETLVTISGYFDRDVDILIASLTSFMEPVLLVFLGAVVGAIVFAVYVPLYSLVGGLH